MTNNLHLTLGDLRTASRILKQTKSISKSGLVDHVFIGHVGSSEDKKTVTLDANRTTIQFAMLLDNKNSGFFSKIYQVIKFYFAALKFSKRENIGVVNVHSLILLPIGALIKLICGAKLIFDTHELETETINKKGIKKAFAKLLESALIRYTDLTIVVGAAIEEWYKEKYDLRDIVTILNCPYYKERITSNALKKLLDIPSDKKIIIYQGALFKGRGIEFLLDVFSRHNDNCHVLVLMGSGELADEIKNFSEHYDNIYYHPAVPVNEIHEYTSSADYGVSIIDGSCLSYYLCQPNKLFEYIMARIPIIINNLPEMRKIVMGRGLGMVLEDYDIQKFYSRLNSLEDKNSAKMVEKFEKAAKEYCWENEEIKMIEKYKTTIFIR